MSGLTLTPQSTLQSTPPSTPKPAPPAAAGAASAPGTMPAPPALPAKPRIGGAVVAGMIILAAFFGGLGSWSVLAPLSSAAVATGVVVVDSNRKTLQHLEGGIIKELLVRNGDEVEQGEVVMRLDTAQASATWNLIRGQRDALRALEARLTAERDEAARVRFPDDLERRRGSPAVAEILSGQETIFAARRRSLQDRTDILRQKIEQLGAEIASRRAQVAAADRQLALIGEEIKAIQELVRKGLERRPRLLSLQRQAANLEGLRGEQLGLIARSQQQIGEAELQIISEKNGQLNAVVAELREVQTELGDVTERAEAARDVLERREIRSPIGGTVVGLRYFTPGGVVAPGDAILDIVPRHDKLTVEAQVQPIDIDVVKVGLKAQVNLSAFKQRTTPTLNGAVAYVSADSLNDPRTGAPYFAARIEIPSAELERLDGLELSPGMPAEVMIVTGERTAFRYLFDPLRESLQRSFREQ